MGILVFKPFAKIYSNCISGGGWSVVNWLTKSGWGEVGFRFVILSIVVNNKIYVICFVV